MHKNSGPDIVHGWRGLWRLGRVRPRQHPSRFHGSSFKSVLISSSSSRTFSYLRRCCALPDANSDASHDANSDANTRGPGAISCSWRTRDRQRRSTLPRQQAVKAPEGPGGGRRGEGQGCLCKEACCPGRDTRHGQGGLIKDARGRPITRRRPCAANGLARTELSRVRAVREQLVAESTGFAL